MRDLAFRENGVVHEKNPPRQLPLTRKQFQM
jgi:hypothetical protein